MNISELFALLNIDKLKELAYKHNVLVSIKAPSTMLKAELVKALSDHYMNLVGTDLIPIAQKPLQMNRLDIPPKFQPKKPDAISSKDKLENRKIQQFKELQLRREKRNAKYMTKEKLDEAIKKRETNQKRVKEKAKLKAEKDSGKRILAQLKQHILDFRKVDLNDDEDKWEDAYRGWKRKYLIINNELQNAVKEKLIKYDEYKLIDKERETILEIIDKYDE